MSLLYNTFRSCYQLLPGSVRAKLDTYRLCRKVRTTTKKLKQRSYPKASLRQTDIGLNIFGFLSSGLGQGEAARSSIRAANSIRLPIFKHDIPLKTHAIDPSEVSLDTYTKSSDFDVNLFHFNPDHLEGLINPQVKKAYLSAGYNIAFWFWETTELPDYWVAASKLFDEIWVGSAFCESIVRPNVAIPVTRIPLNVASLEPDPTFGRNAMDLPENGFLFLTMMDFFSRPERKNPFGSIEAFKRAFDPATPNVYLVVKLISSGANRASKKLRELARKDKRIIIIDKFLSRDQLYSLISFSDCLISLHRAEGFGLPIAEAMSLGKPVIATGWSANMDFMTDRNSFPVPYQMMTLDCYAPPYPKGTVWADPKIDEAANIMRILVDSPALCREIGARARNDINTKFSAEVTGKKILERLMQIQEKI